LKGFIPTPVGVVDIMVAKLFRDHPPTVGSTILDPGCGPGAFIAGVLRWCTTHSASVPQLVGIESDPKLAAEARLAFQQNPSVEIIERDFLEPGPGGYDYIIGNPPYVPITALTTAERDTYRGRYATAIERFDLYLLFYERALSLLKPDGRLVFITPEKFLYVSTAAPLRRLLAERGVEELHFVGEETFGDLVTYPMITTVSASAAQVGTRIILRDGTERHFQLGQLPAPQASWLPATHAARPELAGEVRRLADVCRRISCGVATGADSVFTIRNAHLDQGLRPFAHPTLAGRQIRRGIGPRSMHSLLVPYDRSGALLPESELGPLGEYLADGARREKLIARTCVLRKPWYAFHETPPLADILQPKILCKDITSEPFFVIDARGDIVPRHSVYYIVPNDRTELDSLAAYLNSPPAIAWLKSNCQRAAKGYVRLQSHILKRLPIPARLPHVTSRNLEAIVA
jgi:adenine-specific DNA-methyltransferase